ncbi:MAG: hypothetical protein HKO81_02485 [Flavobacteriaceae bacterium]|nr:hypothetical protein [Flavobacteriaceae bacterium]
MKAKLLLTIVLSLFILTAKAQTNINAYKYVVVPKNYDFLKEADQYQLNSLTKFLFNKNKFNVYFDDENLPEDLFKNRCLALYANVLIDKSLFRTRLTVELKDCYNNVVFVSREGSSKEKNYKKAYHESLRDAFNSFKSLNYSYDPSISEKDDHQGDQSSEKQLNDTKVEVKTPDSEKPIVIIPEVNKMPETRAINESPKMMENIKAKEKIETSGLPQKEDANVKNILYAQAIENGFQLVDNSPKIVYTIFYSGKKNIYIVQGKDAVIYQLNDTWVIAEQLADKLEVNSLNIKF